MYCLTVSGCQESEHGFLGWPGPDPSWPYSPAVRQDCITWRFGWGVRVSFQEGLLTWHWLQTSVLHWLLAGSCSSLSLGPLCKAQNIATSFSQSRWAKRKRVGENPQNNKCVFCYLIWTASLLYVLAHRDGHWYGRWLCKGLNTRRQDSLGAVLEAGYNNLYYKIYMRPIGILVSARRNDVGEMVVGW